VTFQVRAPSIALASPDTDDEFVWVQVAKEGTFKGYAGGEVEFTFDQKLFEQIVKNFRNHPGYVAGEDGYGTADLVAWDYHHASEAPPTSGTIATSGAPAQGWIRDLEVRKGTDGVELWALTRWLEPLRTQIKEGRYQWASVAVVFDAVDPVSGKTVGPVLTSVAATNQPFIEGMTPLAAERFGSTFVDWPASDPNEALGVLKQGFGLPTTATIDEVVAEVAKLRDLVSQNSEIEGVDVDEMVSAMRRLLGLPTLTTADEVFSNVERLLIGLQSESQSDNPRTAEAQASKQEDDMELLKLLAGKLGVKESDKAVLDAVDELLELQDDLASVLELSKKSPRVILDKTKEEKESGAGAREKLNALMKALGVEDPDSGVNQIAELMTQAEELKKAMPELENLRSEAAKREEAEAEADVDAVVNAKGYGDDVRAALLTFRKTSPEEFAKKYPKEELANAHLTRTVAADSRGRQHVPQGGGVQSAAGGAGTIDLSAYPGRNEIEKAEAYVLANTPGADKWTREQRHVAACRLRRQINGGD